VTPEKNEGTLSPEKWPNRAEIFFDAVSLRYSPDGPLVLKKITFSIHSGQKIGIVGRTGAGKSSLVAVLFRLFDFSGNIYIDGVNTKVVPLTLLRSKIATIPQESVLFLGTLRQ